MYAEDLPVDNSAQCQAVKHFSTTSPYIQASVLSDALIIKSVHLCDDSWLVVASQKSDSVFVPDFQGQKEQECLNAVFSSVDVIAHENVIGIRWESTDFEEFKEIVELAVDIAANSDWRWYFDNVGLLSKDLFGLLAEFLNGVLLDFFALLQGLDYLLNVLSASHV